MTKGLTPKNAAFNYFTDVSIAIKFKFNPENEKQNTVQVTCRLACLRSKCVLYTVFDAGKKKKSFGLP